MNDNINVPVKRNLKEMKVLQTKKRKGQMLHRIIKEEKTFKYGGEKRHTAGLFVCLAHFLIFISFQEDYNTSNVSPCSMLNILSIPEYNININNTQRNGLGDLTRMGKNQQSYYN